ncbi:MAG: hypothetical protein JXB34_05210 [Bacteroidales bacterium]|nr:hypothetical protein [Bacteroidales bacterium]
MKYSRVLLILFLSLLFITCRHATQDAQKGGDIDTIDIQQLTEERLAEIYHRFPSPDEMLFLLHEKQIAYQPALVNNPERADNYLTSMSQALNLGVYVADFAYISAFKRFKESSAYFESIYQLCDNLNISSAFERSVLKRIQDNINNPDSLKSISDVAFRSVNSYLISNNKEKTFALISIGGFVEALYLTFELAAVLPSDSTIKQHIADQKYVLDNIVEFSSFYSDNNDIPKALEMISEITGAYAKAEIIVEETKTTKTADGKLVISGGDRIYMPDNLYQQLHKATVKVRNQFIQL